MKIVVGATRQPHALSRRQIEAIFSALPPEVTGGIREVWLETGPWYAGRFEYDAQNARVRLALVVPEKTPETAREAIRILLEGLARLRAGEPFFERVRRGQKDHEGFVNEWLPTCLHAAT